MAGTLVRDITEIHSHQQALRQYKDYLSEHFWTRPLIEDDDTAEASRRLSEGKLPKTADVIANKACADLYGLEILQERIYGETYLTFVQFFGEEYLFSPPLCK